MIIKFDQYIKEGLIDKMTPKSKEDILKSFDNLTPEELFKKGEWEGYGDLMITAIEKGYDLNSNNKEGLTAIIRQNHTKVVEYLLKKGYDLTLEKGFDPFYIAALNGHDKMIKLMIKYDVEMVGMNSIIVARTMHHDESARLLIDYYKKTHSIHESLRDKMTPKSKDDLINTFINADDSIKKRMMIKLVRNMFKDRDDFMNFVKFSIGISSWNRISKKVSSKYSYDEELVNVMKKHEINKLFKDIVNNSLFNLNIL